MSGNVIFDWALMAISLFNTIVLLWLGLTVLLNAERRMWGLWLAGGGLLAGALFFISHSVILSIGLHDVGDGLEIWWRVGWVPVLALPLVWYVLILWYVGFFDEPATAPHAQRAQRGGLMFTTLLGLGLFLLFAFANPLPPIAIATRAVVLPSVQLNELILLVITYSLFCLACITLSLEALRRPNSSAHTAIMPSWNLARRRARPWLMATAVVLLCVSLLVAWVMLWALSSVNQQLDFQVLLWFDLLTAALIAVAALLIGQAIIAYEVFTRQTLPRRGFSRYWYNAIILAAGFSSLLSGALLWRAHPVYGVLLGVTLVAIFYALVVWRSYVDREHTMAQLRPFVSSQRLYEQLLSPSPLSVDVSTPFRALCADVLSARAAQLIAVGALAPLVDAPLSYPTPTPFKAPLNEFISQFDSPQTMGVPLDAARYDGAEWAVPLWSERGPIGVLLLGGKADGGLYTQEEIEIARASGERLIDTQASVELARRLMTLQRQRLADSQLVDRRARRVLHDDVLPQLHAAMLMLNGQAHSAHVLETLTDTHQQIANLLRDLPPATPEVAQLGLLGALRQLIEREYASAFDGVTWQVDATVEREARTLPPPYAEVLLYATREAIRNAARHGRGDDGARPLHLRVTIDKHPVAPHPELVEGGLSITIEDDGVGVTTPSTHNGGSGQGLALHSTMLAIIGGTLEVESVAGQYTRVVLRLPHGQ
jgi:signal transduction histidine kinase